MLKPKFIYFFMHYFQYLKNWISWIYLFSKNSELSRCISMSYYSSYRILSLFFLSYIILILPIVYYPYSSNHILSLFFLSYVIAFLLATLTIRTNHFTCVLNTKSLFFNWNIYSYSYSYSYSYYNNHFYLIYNIVLSVQIWVMRTYHSPEPIILSVGEDEEVSIADVAKYVAGKYARTVFCLMYLKYAEMKVFLKKISCRKFFSKTWFLNCECWMNKFILYPMILWNIRLRKWMNFLFEYSVCEDNYNNWVTFSSYKNVEERLFVLLLYQSNLI